jgi:hypothetical protein
MERELRSGPSSPPYEPPLVERVLTADEIAREVHYAGLLEPSGRGDLSSCGSYECGGSAG